jgi:hypothetical protein
VDTADWVLMVSMYVMLGPWIGVIFYAIWKWGPEVRRETLMKEGMKSD